MPKKPPPPAGPSALNARQERFVREYLVDSNGKQAAIRAGYSAATAEQCASRLLRNRKVAEAIAARRGVMLGKLDISAERVLEGIGEIAFAPKPLAGDDAAPEAGGVSDALPPWPVRMKALETLARYHGLLTDKVQHEVGPTLEQLLLAAHGGGAK